MTENQMTLPQWDDALCDDLVRIALDIGEGLLENGAEVHRVEVAIETVCKAYGAAHTEVFSISSLIIAAVRMPNGAYSSQSRRIHGSTNNLSALERFNALSRRLCAEKPSFEEADRLIREAKLEKAYSFPLVLFGSLLAAGGFAVFFGGSWRDGIAAALIGFFITIVDNLHAPHLNRMAKTLIVSFMAGVLSSLSVWIGLGESIDMINIGTIMLLIPGLALGNALRDLIGGDTLTGTLKVVQSLIVAAMIAIGYTLAILVTGGIAL